MLISLSKSGNQNYGQSALSQTQARNARNNKMRINYHMLSFLSWSISALANQNVVIYCIYNLLTYCLHVIHTSTILCCVDILLLSEVIAIFCQESTNNYFDIVLFFLYFECMCVVRLSMTALLGVFKDLPITPMTFF